MVLLLPWRNQRLQTLLSCSQELTGMCCVGRCARHTHRTGVPQANTPALSKRNSSIQHQTKQNQTFLKSEGEMLDLSSGLNSPTPLVTMWSKAKLVTALEPGRLSDPDLATSTPVNDHNRGSPCSWFLPLCAPFPGKSVGPRAQFYSAHCVHRATVLCYFRFHSPEKLQSSWFKGSFAWLWCGAVATLKRLPRRSCS